MHKIKSHDAAEIVHKSIADAAAWKSAAAQAKRTSSMLMTLIDGGERLGLDLASLQALRTAAAVARHVAEIYRDAAWLKSQDEARFARYQEDIVRGFRPIWDAMSLAERVALICMLDSTQLHGGLGQLYELKKGWNDYRAALFIEVYRSWRASPPPRPETVVCRLHERFLSEKSMLLHRHASDIAKIADELSHRWGV